MSMPDARDPPERNRQKSERKNRKKTPECRQSGVKGISSAYFFFAVFFFTVLADPQPQPFFAGMKNSPFD
jgi:hypothetical protein